MLDELFTWSLSTATILGQIVLLNKVAWAPVFGMGLQGTWAVYFASNGTYEFVIPALVGLALYAKSMRDWKKPT